MENNESGSILAIWNTELCQLCVTICSVTAGDKSYFWSNLRSIFIIIIIIIILLFCFSASLARKQITETKGEGMIAGYVWRDGAVKMTVIESR